jgi:hypothetical protein
MPTVVYLDRNYSVVSAEIEGGRYITEAAYKGEPEETPLADAGAGEIATEEGQQA